jgi:hypothetical protein
VCRRDKSRQDESLARVIFETKGPKSVRAEIKMVMVDEMGGKSANRFGTNFPQDSMRHLTA